MVRIDDGVFIISVYRVVLCVDYENEVKNTDCMGRKKSWLRKGFWGFMKKFYGSNR